MAKLDYVSFLPKDHQRLSFPYVKGLVGSPVSDDLTRTKWQENLRESFTWNTLKEIISSSLPYLWRKPDFLKDSAASKTELVNKAIARISCRVFTILRGFLEKALPFLRIGILTRPMDKKTAELPKKKVMRETGAYSSLTRK